MAKGWLHNKLAPKGYNCIEWNSAADGVQLSVIQVEISGQSLSVHKIAEQIAKDDLAEHIDPALPALLCISGKGVIGRSVDAHLKTEKAVLQSLLPNAQLEDFFIQKTESISLDGATPAHVAAAIRSSQLDEYLSFLTELKLRVIDVGLAIPLVSEGANVLEFDQDINYNAFRIEHRSTAVEFGEFQPQRLTVGSDQIQSNCFGSFYLAVKNQIGGPCCDSVPVVAHTQGEEKQRSIFNMAGVAVLVVFLVGLLANYFAFDHHNKRLAELESEQMVSKGIIKQVDSLRTYAAKQQKLIRQTGIDGQAQTAFYLDALAASMPETILLDAMRYAPLERRVRDGKPIKFENDKITIQGNTKDVGEVERWMTAIRGEDWTSSIQLLAFTNSGENKGDFKLEVQL